MATIRTAISASPVDVTNAINGVGFGGVPLVAGDTVHVPAGTVSVTSTFNLTIGINVIGKTTVNSDTGAVDDQTIWLDDVSVPSRQNPVVLMNVVGGTGIKARFSGFTIRVGSQTVVINNGTFQMINTCTGYRVDNCHFDSMIQVHIVTQNAAIGVIDHNVFSLAKNTKALEMNHPGWAGKTNGDGSWAADTGFGTDQFMFFENNYVLRAPAAASTFGMCDGTKGGRVVIRYCTMIDVQYQNHGTESGRFRGHRASEVYNNTWHFTKTPQGQNSGGSRSGCMLVHHNDYTGFNPINGLSQQAYRMHFNWEAVPYPKWYGCSGQNTWDVNATSVDGLSHVPGDPDRQFASGTCDNLAPDKFHLRDSGSGWSVNQWKGYVARRVLDGKIALITSNTSDTLTVLCFPDPPGATWANSDGYTIHKCLIALDQCGRGKSDLLANDPPVNTALGNTPKWPRNQLEPVYGWLNFFTGNIPVEITAAVSQNPQMFENRDFYNYTASFNGSVGIGSGLHSARPNSGLTPGVGYWETDTETLFVATGPTTWSSYYTPFTYPHPLVGVTSPTINSLATTTFTVGVAGSFQITTAGFTGTIVYSKTGSFPSGVSLNTSTGVISGTPAGGTAGSYSLTLTATVTSPSQTDSQSFTLVVAAASTKVIALSGSMAFGNVDINTTLTKTLTIANTGNTDLAITSISYPSGYTGDYASGTIPPNGTQAVLVTFAPIAGTTYNGTITVSSDKTSGTNTASATGVGATRIISLSSALSFGSITTGQTATLSATISNTGDVPLVVSGVTYPTGFSGNYSGSTIAAGGSTSFNVTFSPTLVQAYSGSINFTSNKTSGTSTLAVSGTGTASATKIVQLSGNMAFGSVLDGTTLTKALTITNSGNATLAVTDVTLPSGYDSDWTAGDILAGASQIANITFSPVAATTYNGDVTVVSDATGGTDTKAITGTGVAPTTKVIALSGDMAFGNVTINTTVTRTLTITNTGTALLTVTSITYPTGFTGAFSGTIAPGASHDVSVVFAPTLVQSYSGTITVASDKTSGTNTVSASGAGVNAVTKVIGVTGDLSFGNVQKNHTQQRTFVISNTGTSDLAVTNITCPTGFSTDITTATITPGGNQSVVLTFAPGSAGQYGGTITVASDKTAGVNTIMCSGTGTNKRQVPFFLIVH